MKYIFTLLTISTSALSATKEYNPPSGSYRFRYLKVKYTQDNIQSIEGYFQPGRRLRERNYRSIISQFETEAYKVMANDFAITNLTKPVIRYRLNRLAYSPEATFHYQNKVFTYRWMTDFFSRDDWTDQYFELQIVKSTPLTPPPPPSIQGSLSLPTSMMKNTRSRVSLSANFDQVGSAGTVTY